MRSQAWVAKARRIDRVASPETLRQHLDNLADAHLEDALRRVRRASLDLICRSGAPITPCSTGHVCLDGDTTPLDNGKTKKEGVSRTYMPDVFGFAPMFVFAGGEGWCLREEFRPGKQHGQKGATSALGHADVAQCLNDRRGTRLATCLLVNFRRGKIQVRRLGMTRAMATGDEHV